jgi:hypothetical protein
MKHTLRCHDFGWRHVGRSMAVRIGGESVGAPRAKIAPAHKGLRPESSTRRNVEQGPACGMRPCRRVKGPRIRRSIVPLRGAGGTRSRGPVFGDATVEPAMSASQPAQCASSRSDPQRGPSSSLRRAIQAEKAWNLLRPTRDALSRGLPIQRVLAAPRFALSTILARTARAFHYVRGSRR